MRHSVHMRYLRGTVGLLLAGALAVGCSAEEEPEEPSAEERYCAAFRDYYERSSDGGDKHDAEVVASMKTFAAEAAALELPDTMSADAQAGLKAWIDLIDEVPANASQDEVAALGQDLSAEQVEQLDAYYLYSNARCLSATSGG